MEQTKIIFMWTFIILIITLSVVSYMITVTKKTYLYPPHINVCPDYYYMSSIGNCYDKRHVFHDTKSTCYSENFNRILYKNSGIGIESGMCKKKLWANTCNVSWDGITNNSKLCI